jgi:hypothetical protein
VDFSEEVKRDIETALMTLRTCSGQQSMGSTTLGPNLELQDETNDTSRARIIFIFILYEYYYMKMIVLRPFIIIIMINIIKEHKNNDLFTTYPIIDTILGRRCGSAAY